MKHIFQAMAKKEQDVTEPTLLDIMPNMSSLSIAINDINTSTASIPTLGTVDATKIKTYAEHEDLLVTFVPSVDAPIAPQINSVVYNFQGIAPTYDVIDLSSADLQTFEAYLTEGNITLPKLSINTVPPIEPALDDSVVSTVFNSSAPVYTPPASTTTATFAEFISGETFAPLDVSDISAPEVPQTVVALMNDDLPQIEYTAFTSNELNAITDSVTDFLDGMGLTEHLLNVTAMPPVTPTLVTATVDVSAVNSGHAPTYNPPASFALDSYTVTDTAADAQLAPGALTINASPPDYPSDLIDTFDNYLDASAYSTRMSTFRGVLSGGAEVSPPGTPDFGGSYSSQLPSSLPSIASAAFDSGYEGVGSIAAVYPSYTSPTATPSAFTATSSLTASLPGLPSGWDLGTTTDITDAIAEAEEFLVGGTTNGGPTTGASGWLDDEDPEMVSAAIAGVNGALQRAQAGLALLIEESRVEQEGEFAAQLQRFQADVAQYQSSLNIEIQTWRTANIEKFNAEVQDAVATFNASAAKYDGVVRAEIADCQARAQQASKEGDLDLQAMIQEYALDLQRYDLSLKEYQNAVNRDNQEYQADVARYQGAIQEYQATLSASVQDVQTELQVALEGFRADTAAYTARYGKFSAEVQAYSVEIQDKVSEHNTNLEVYKNALQYTQGKWQSEIAVWQAKQVQKLDDYKNQQSNSLAQFNAEMAKYQETVKMSIKNADLEKTNDLELFQAEIQRYQIGVNAEISEYQSQIETIIKAWSVEGENAFKKLNIQQQD